MSLRDELFRPPSYQSERLVLRGYEPSDAESIFAYASDEETTRYMLWERHRTLADSFTFLDGFVAAAYRAGHHEYAICLRAQPERAVGGIGLRVTSARHQTAELGYILHRDLWGQGLVVEAARMLLAQAFERDGIERVFAPILSENARSRRVAEKLGFSLEGVLRSAWSLRGRRWDEVRYGLLRSEWPASASGAARVTRTLPWLDWARQIAALAQTGLAFTKDAFDRQRYEALRALSLEIAEHATCVGEPAVAADVSAVLLAGASGYATPKLDVRAAVFRREPDGQAAVLMVKERADGKWTLPGGWVDVGESPAQAVEKEVREESGYEVKARKLIALYDRDRQGHPPFMFHVWKVILACEIVGGSAHTAGDGLEIDAVAFFRPQALPELSLTRILPGQIARCFAHYEHPELPAEFD